MPFYNFKTFLILLCILFTLQTGVAQSVSKIDSLSNSYASYFNPERETIYLHFSKTSFLTTEAIWFKGYIYDKKTSIPFITTTNVYVTLYNGEGKEIESKLFYAKNGTFSGSFDTAKTFETGHYFVKAYTNWMKNFKEDETYTSSAIQILNPEEGTEITDKEKPTDFDLQFLPEGGYCIADTRNSIGFKIINCEGNGTKIEGNILDSKNNILTNFKSNEFGMGKVDLKMIAGETYTASYTINDKSYRTKLPQAQAFGFSISVNNYTNDKITYINLRTNQSTLKKEHDKTYYLVINQTNKTSTTQLTINDLNEDYIIPIETKNLLSGINTVTLFNDQLQPVLERLIFNFEGINFIKSDVTVKKRVGDSIAMQIKTTTKNNLPVATNLSVSILPSETMAYSKNDDIISALLVAPYLRGSVQNPTYYFTDVNRLKKYDLDLLLLTQGWSKYEWKNIRSGIPNLVFPFDKGLSIEGTVNETIDPNSVYEIQMYSFVNNMDETIALDKNQKFHFDNFYVADSAKINFSVYKDGKQIVDPKMYVRLIDNKRTLLEKAFEPIGVCAPIEKTIKHLEFINDPFSMKGQLLDTITLFAAHTPKKPKLANQKSYLANAYGKGIKIDSTEQRMYPYVVDIINANGFNADQRGGVVSITNRRPISFLAGGAPLLIIDDVTLGNNFDILYNVTLDEIDEIYFNKNGLGYGSRGGAGVIRIYRKKGSVYGKLNKKNSNQLEIKNGFSVDKKFYIPEFYSFSKSDYLNYGSVDWKPNLVTDSNGLVNFKIYNTSIKKVMVIIQGMTLKGTIISEIKEIELPEN